jgi:hypothetical protein
MELIIGQSGRKFELPVSCYWKWPISNFKTENLSNGLAADTRSQTDMATDKFILLRHKMLSKSAQRFVRRDVKGQSLFNSSEIRVA